MIHVNVRGLLIREYEGKLQLLIQLRKRADLLKKGDDSADIHWAGKEELHTLIDEHRFSEIDLPAVLMYMRDKGL